MKPWYKTFHIPIHIPTYWFTWTDIPLHFFTYTGSLHHTGSFANCLLQYTGSLFSILTSMTIIQYHHVIKFYTYAKIGFILSCFSFVGFVFLFFRLGFLEIASMVFIFTSLFGNHVCIFLFVLQVWVPKIMSGFFFSTSKSSFYVCVWYIRVCVFNFQFFFTLGFSDFGFYPNLFCTD